MICDEGSDRVVVEQLIHTATYGPEEVLVETKQLAHKAIREKALESYRNGQAAGPQ